MTAPLSSSPHFVFHCKWKMCATCYSRARQQRGSRAQTHISRVLERVGGQTPMHLETGRMPPYMCVNFSAFLADSVLCMSQCREGSMTASLPATHHDTRGSLMQLRIMEAGRRDRRIWCKRRRMKCFKTKKKTLWNNLCGIWLHKMSKTGEAKAQKKE